MSAKKLLLLNPFKNFIIHRDPTIGMKANCVIKRGGAGSANYASTIKDKFTIRSDAQLLKSFLTEKKDITTVILSPYDYEVTKVLIKDFPCSAIRDNDDSLLIGTILGFKEKLNITTSEILYVAFNISQYELAKQCGVDVLMYSGRGYEHAGNITCGDDIIPFLKA